jgi:hypothetical protein
MKEYITTIADVKEKYPFNKENYFWVGMTSIALVVFLLASIGLFIYVLFFWGAFHSAL